MKIAVVGEFDYTDEFATEQDALDDLNAVMELVADIYMPELGVAVYPDVEVVTDPSDPYFPIVSTTTSGQILTMVGAYRVAENHLANGYGATHLVMNSASAAGNLGVTNTQICNTGGGTWWKARLNKPMFNRVVTAAHELAHNCGAGHDNDLSHCPGTLFEAGGAGTDQHIMQSAGDYADSSTFSVCSKYAARNRIYSSTQPTSCLTPVTCGDATGNGLVQASDGLLALQLAVCGSCAFNGLADVEPQPIPNLVISAVDANAILQMAVGSLGIPTECGQPHCVCDDGTQACHEECDDGNLANGDGCTQYCQIE